MISGSLLAVFFASAAFPAILSALGLGSKAAAAVKVVRLAHKVASNPKVRQVVNRPVTEEQRVMIKRDRVRRRMDIGSAMDR